MLFSAELPVLFYFVQVFGYLGTLEKSQKIILKISIPEASAGPKGGHRPARGQPGGCLARPTPWPRHLPSWVGPTPPGALHWPLFILPSRKRRNRSRFFDLRRSRRNPLFFLGELTWRLNWPPVRGKSSPSTSSSPLHHPSMTSSLMCE